MKKRNLFLTLGLALTLGAGVAGGLSLNRGEVKEVEAYTSRTVYCAIYGNALGNYTLKLNANVGDGNTWLQSDMVNTGKTYENRMIFRGTFEERYGGVDGMQFQIYDGSTWKWERQPISGWTTYETYTDKMYVINNDGGEWSDYKETTVNFVDKDGVDGDFLEYNAANNQYEGVYTTSVDNETMKLKKTTGETATNLVTLDSYLSEDVATSDGSKITIKKASAYMIYYKDDGNIWIQDAEPYLVAYAYAGYFLTHIGCDPQGQLAPTGWASLATRYSGLADDVKDYIYAFNTATAEEGDDIADMIKTYNWAINHNPNSLSHFVVDHSGNERAIPAAAINIAPTVTESNSFVPVVVVVVSVISLVTVASIFVIRRRKEQE